MLIRKFSIKHPSLKSDQGCNRDVLRPFGQSRTNKIKFEHNDNITVAL